MVKPIRSSCPFEKCCSLLALDWCFGPYFPSKQSMSFSSVTIKNLNCFCFTCALLHLFFVNVLLSNFTPMAIWWTFSSLPFTGNISMKIFRTSNSTQWTKTTSLLTVQNLQPEWVYATKFQIFWKTHFLKFMNNRYSVLYYFGIIIEGFSTGMLQKDRMFTSLLCDKLGTTELHSVHPRTAGQRRGGGPGSRAVLWTSSSFSVAWNVGNLRNFLKKRGEKQVGTKLKRNKTPIVLSCICFHWKTTIFLHNPFTFRNFHFRSNTLSSDPWNGDGWPWKYVLLGMTVCLSKQIMYWPYPTFRAGLHPGFCMSQERDCSQDQTWFSLGCSLILPSCWWQGLVPELALECLSAGLLERKWCIAGRWTDPARQLCPKHFWVLLKKQKCVGLSHIFLGLSHRNVKDTCMFCEGFFNSLVL